MKTVRRGPECSRVQTDWHVRTAVLAKAQGNAEVKHTPSNKRAGSTYKTHVLGITGPSENPRLGRLLRRDTNTETHKEQTDTSFHPS